MIYLTAGLTICVLQPSERSLTCPAIRTGDVSDRGANRAENAFALSGKPRESPAISSPMAVN